MRAFANVAPTTAMSSPPSHHPRNMAAHRIRQLKALEGQRVALAVRGGTRIGDCELV